MYHIFVILQVHRITVSRLSMVSYLVTYFNYLYVMFMENLFFSHFCCAILSRMLQVELHFTKVHKPKQIISDTVLHHRKMGRCDLNVRVYETKQK